MRENTIVARNNGIFIFLQFLEPSQFKVIEQSLGVDRDF